MYKISDESGLIQNPLLAFVVVVITTTAITASTFTSPSHPQQ